MYMSPPLILSHAHNDCTTRVIVTVIRGPVTGPHYMYTISCTYPCHTLYTHRRLWRLRTQRSTPACTGRFPDARVYTGRSTHSPSRCTVRLACHVSLYRAHHRTITSSRLRMTLSLTVCSCHTQQTHTYIAGIHSWS